MEDISIENLGGNRLDISIENMEDISIEIRRSGRNFHRKLYVWNKFPSNIECLEVISIENQMSGRYFH